jgi:uncharacterized membrane protein YeaQ/YmgE (transglycosylase-associated protein family)
MMSWIYVFLIGLLVGFINRLLENDEFQSINFSGPEFVAISGSFIAAVIGKTYDLYRLEEPIGLLMSILGSIVFLFLISFFKNNLKKD